ncbi:hypothetical protein [Clostridium taeniosporum]|uniref:Uncharacterized protein n=1 Tax=Clostridium taeniosporum TaxID=394958 RepID=A0A1D7XJC6_9CLOT|nr:hypothetical protein [Clostridium taeniosporum]AOR23447.1 hypothetical protein BGI42_06710 [Clostridium taeniosporum]
MKKNRAFLGVLVVLLTIRFSRFMVGKYGEDIRIKIMVAALVVSILCLVGIIYKKKYLATLIALSLIVPLLVMTIGMYLDNLYLGVFGFGLMFILIPIMIKYKNEEEK